MTAVEITNETVEQAAHAMYADVEVGPWELGPLHTLLAYRRAARIALEAAPRPVVDREALVQVVAEYIDDLDSVPPMGTSAEHLERRAVHVADAVLALLNGTKS